MKKNSIKGIMIIVMGILMISGVVVYGFNRDRATPKYFTSYKEKGAKKIYEEITTRDLESDYPNSIEDLIDFHNNILTLIYGDMLKNNEKLEEIISIERKLYTEELLDKNTLKSQHDNVIKNLEKLKENGIHTIGIERVSVVVDRSDERSSSVKVNQYINKTDNVEWIYYLKADENLKWKINSWEIVK